MSTPRHLDLAAEVHPVTLEAASGPIAALVARSEAAEPRGEVLLLPGYTGSKEDFIHLLPVLARAGYASTAIDLRGQYESGGPADEEAYRLPALAADIVSLVDHPLHLVGHSFGGLVAREAALAGAPLRSLTLFASGPGALGGQRGRVVDLMRPLLLERGVAGMWALQQELAGDVPEDQRPSLEVRAFLEKRFLASPMEALLGMGNALAHAPDRVDELRGLGLPILVVHGARDDAWVPAVQADMAERLGARYVVLPDLGHSPAVEDEHAVADTFCEFWAAV